MNFKETMEHLLAGGKIVRMGWNNDYVYLEDGRLVNESGQFSGISGNFDYQKYEEPKSKVTLWRRPIYKNANSSSWHNTSWFTSKEEFEYYYRLYHLGGEWESMEVEL